MLYCGLKSLFKSTPFANSQRQFEVYLTSFEAHPNKMSETLKPVETRQKQHPKPSTPRTPLGGHALVKHVLRSGSGKSNQLMITDLDTAVLAARLSSLKFHLKSLKSKCETHKSDAETMAVEIEACKRETTEYIEYLSLKRTEKGSAIAELGVAVQVEFDAFIVKRDGVRDANRRKIMGVQELISGIDVKIGEKEQEIALLSDTIKRKAIHDEEIGAIRQEMNEAEQKHIKSMFELEKTLLDDRLNLQREAELQIRSMEVGAKDVIKI